MTETNIEWTDVTWNPVRGCSKVSAGCANCYAERAGARLATAGDAYDGLIHIGEGSPRWTGEVRLVAERLDDPRRWKKPKRIFVNSMSDLFHEKLTDHEIRRVVAAMGRAPQHTFQVLTKRQQRMHDALRSLETERFVYAESGRGAWPLSNVWLGVSVENQAAADERIPWLLETPAAVRFLSVEPLLGPVDLAEWLDPAAGPCGLERVDLDWVIVGGESGPGARACDVAWIRSVVEQCRKYGVPVFVKQLGKRRVETVGEGVCTANKTLNVIKARKGNEMSEWPADLRVREFPRAA